MRPVRFLPLALLTPVLLAVSGCEDSTAPGDLGTLDPVEVSAAMGNLVVPLRASAEARGNLGAAVPDLTEAGIEFLRTDPSLALPTIASGWFEPAREPRLPLLPLRFPPEIIGSTFTFTLPVDGWEVDETRTGAPEDGVRVVWYDLEDNTGTLNVPLIERGRIDLRPRDGGAADSLAMNVVQTLESGSLTLLDLVQARETTGTDVVEQMFRATGSYSNGSATVDFRILSDDSEVTSSGDQTSTLEISLEEGESSYVMEVEGSVDGASDAYEFRLQTTAVHDGSTTVLNAVFRGTGDVQEEVSGTFEHDGTVVANVNSDGNSVDFTSPDGGSFSAAQASQLNRLFRALALNGGEVFVNLPLFLPE